MGSCITKGGIYDSLEPSVILFSSYSFHVLCDIVRIQLKDEWSFEENIGNTILKWHNENDEEVTVEKRGNDERIFEYVVRQKHDPLKMINFILINWLINRFKLALIKRKRENNNIRGKNAGKRSLYEKATNNQDILTLNCDTSHKSVINSYHGMSQD